MRLERRGLMPVLAILTGGVALVSAAAAAGVPETPATEHATQTGVRFPPILLPESGAPAPVVDAAGRARGTEVVVAFVVDTFGRVEARSAEVLSAPDSAAAAAVRASLPGLRYVPARIVMGGGASCVRFDDAHEHCGGPRPHVRRLRARVVLRVQSFVATAR